MRRTIKTFKPGYVLIDSLSRTHQGDENSKKEMSVVTGTWGDLAQQYDLAFSLIHHVPKANEGTKPLRADIIAAHREVWTGGFNTTQFRNGCGHK
jgi:RecA-family ATPase